MGHICHLYSGRLLDVVQLCLHHCNVFTFFFVIGALLEAGYGTIQAIWLPSSVLEKLLSDSFLLFGGAFLITSLSSVNQVI